MTHLGEGSLQELLDGEMPPGARAEAEAHLASCPACAGELAELRGLTARASALLGLVEAAPPVLAAQARFARHRRGGGAMSEARRALPRAAALVLLLAGAAAAAAIPGSPAREWVRGLGVSQREEQPAPPQAAPEAPAPAVVEVAPKAVSINPSEGRIRIAVTASSPELRVRARLVPGAKAEVTATGAASTARFRTGPGRIEVMGAGPGELVITLPADADAAFVEVNGRVLAAKQGAALRSLAPRVAGSATEPVFRAGGN
ncbi:anti-sigma factor family protein [Longimicrobium sp.]|uniref:anti-sigma factor family protein n=1 Tax=Longimicrobium sp. TaxID=2029185 RepID=UPI003B3B1E71